MSIDAGIEWLGYHATETRTSRHPRPSIGEQYTRLWASYRECVVVANSSSIGLGCRSQTSRHPHIGTLLFVGQPMPLYVYRSSAAGCLP